MNLTLIRDIFTPKSTSGLLLVDGGFFCYTLEDRIRTPGVKIPKETCIPAGHYRVVLAYSPKRDTNVPYLLNVPQFTAIQIHSGNWPTDTEGCILVGISRKDDAVFDSRMAYQALFTQMCAAVNGGQTIWIDIVNLQTAAFIELTT